MFSGVLKVTSRKLADCTFKYIDWDTQPYRKHKNSRPPTNPKHKITIHQSVSKVKEMQIRNLSMERERNLLTADIYWRFKNSVAVNIAVIFKMVL